MNKLLAWLDARVGFRESVLPMMTHPIPRGAAGPMGWWYVFGSASMTLLAIQILTGIGLAMVYVPTAEDAYESLQYLNYVQPWGWFLRALHNASAGGMVLMVAVHMTQVFLHGSFKYPRELTWCLGVCLLLLTLGLAFTGQVLRWDGDAYWGLGVGAAMAGRVPYLGPWIVRLLLGGPIIGADTLSRFFALHRLVLPGLLLAVLGAAPRWCARGSPRRWCSASWSIRRRTTRSTTSELKRGVLFLETRSSATGLFSGAGRHRGGGDRGGVRAEGAMRCPTRRCPGADPGLDWPFPGPTPRRCCCRPRSRRRSS
ncbi:MAG: cytochrome b N-terminal domain-containing protein [Gemmataceae bacterium]